MSLNFAILGFLHYQPLSGYDLKKLFDSTVRHFWYADQSQIYRTLEKLLKDGYVEHETVVQDTRPDRKVYSLTASGRQAFAAWLQGPFPQQPPKSGPLVQIFFSAQLSDEVMIQRFEMAAEIFRSVLRQYESVPEVSKAALDGVNSAREQYFWLKTLDLGIRTMQANLAWAEQILAELRSHSVPES